ncbi:hypothetical protein EVG20_g978 [Dentipellis fragilis]|uniref:Uncharacterized protein n=1 Tax=Dentipellis fragilis TaxID=205917 RepID=A0A4Y9ZBV6_9AGAM|nr:hypothetical protein EVG20_g978 [Dentipellis fragilis]
MSTEPMTEDAPGTELADAHEMRITSHGKMRGWVDFALQFFEANGERPLVLHTLPAKPKDEQVNGVAEGTETRGEKTKEKSMASATATIPRLVSVVEIIKREYLKTIDMQKELEKSGLYQYNEIGYLEEEQEVEESLEDRADMIAKALDGTKNVRIQRTPYMKVTLCRTELPQLATQGKTAQAPLKRKLAKSARARLRKKLKRAEAD